MEFSQLFYRFENIFFIEYETPARILVFVFSIDMNSLTGRKRHLAQAKPSIPQIQILFFVFFAKIIQFKGGIKALLLKELFFNEMK